MGSLKVPSEIFPNPETITTNKPILNGQYVINGQIHDILYYVDKNNPTGPMPRNPASDSQFNNWEEPVKIWAMDNGYGG